MIRIYEMFDKKMYTPNIPVLCIDFIKRVYLDCKNMEEVFVPNFVFMIHCILRHNSLAVELYDLGDIDDFVLVWCFRLCYKKNENMAKFCYKKYVKYKREKTKSFYFLRILAEYEFIYENYEKTKWLYDLFPYQYMKKRFMLFIKSYGNYRLHAKMDDFLNPKPCFFCELCIRFFSIISEDTKRLKYAYCPECNQKCSSWKGKSSIKQNSKEEVEFERILYI